MIETLDAFAAAMAVAERHRKVLRQKFGMSDHDIGTLTLARQPKRSPMSDYAKAVIIAKRRLESKHVHS